MGFTTESTRVVIAVVITPGFLGASTCGVAVSCGAVSATESGVSIVELDAAVSGCAEAVGVSATAVFADDSAVERVATLVD
jgi:hypothetical protein